MKVHLGLTYTDRSDGNVRLVTCWQLLNNAGDAVGTVTFEDGRETHSLFGDSVTDSDRAELYQTVAMYYGVRLGESHRFQKGLLDAIYKPS